MTETVALTGASGFVGRHLLARLRQAGSPLRVLSRRGPVGGVETIAGDLADEHALRRLVDGADRVVHLAGLVKSPHAEAFTRVNAHGTERLARAIAASTARLVLVSSLAARHPGVSAYAASKRAAETAALAVLGAERVTVVRPPAIYGPGDRATLLIFRQLAGRWLLAPGPADTRFSLLHVSDLTDLLAAHLTAGLSLPPLLEPDDGTPGGYGWSDLARLAERTTGRRARTINVPVALLRPPARLADWLGRRFALDLPLGLDKLGELGHGQWVAAGPPLPQWQQRITFEEGFAATLDWYRRAGWL